MDMKESFESLKRKYSILRGDNQDKDDDGGRTVTVKGKSIYVRTNFRILLETLSEVVIGHSIFNRIYDRYLILEGDNSFDRLVEAIRLDEEIPVSIVLEGFND